MLEDMDMDPETDYSENQMKNFMCETDNDSVEDNVADWYNTKELDSDDIELIKKSSDSVFSFETDHAALKVNTDYHSLIKALVILQAQRIKTIEDIDRLEKLRHIVRNNPKKYLNKFIIGDTSDIPARIVVQQVPKIDWSKYNNKNSGDLSCTPTETTVPDLEQSIIPKEVHCDSVIKNSMTVRGRAFDQSKPQTFNQLWTAEEQLRLEELLLEFPPERNENSRWRKIAQALGNRTTKQVCSRVQKYFKKLNKAGLPIPGHQLKTNNMTSLKKKPRRYKRLKTRNSTFFPTNHLGAPQLLDSCEEDESKIKTLALTIDQKSDIIKQIIEFKRKDSQLAPFTHPGMKCYVCAEMPIQGTRWHCLVCQSVNLCSDCVISQLGAETVLHSLAHPMEPLTNPTVAHWDPDYTLDSFQSTNYLDPNFVT